MSSPPVPESLLRQVVATYSPRRVILFGSRARGDARPDSDVDLLVVVGDDTPPEAVAGRGAEARRGHDGDVDILLWRERDLRRREHLRGSLAGTIRREGVTVYEDPACGGEVAPLSEDEKVTPAEEARHWVKRAASDRRVAAMAVAVDPPEVEAAGFHAQQAAERLVKALLILADREVPKLHDLRRLVELLGEASPIPADLVAEPDGLSDWVITGRYDDAPAHMSVSTAERVAEALALLARLDAVVAEALDRAG